MFKLKISSVVLKTGLSENQKLYVQCLPNCATKLSLKSWYLERFEAVGEFQSQFNV